MYKNLEAEIVRHDISKEDIAHTINKSYQTIMLKLSGKYSFTLDEALDIRNSYFPEFSLDYLFQKQDCG